LNGSQALARVYRFDVAVTREVGDTTEELPSIVRARRLLHIALAVFALGAFGLAAVLAIAPPQGAPSVAPETTAAVDAEAQRLATVLDSTTKAVHAQAEAMTNGPQIRAGIMTDAATVKDLVANELQLPRNLNQTLELVQLRDGTRTVLLTLPEGSPPIGAGTAARFAIDGRKQVAVVVALPIAPYDAASTVTGKLVLSTPLDFMMTRENLAQIAMRATLSGDGWRFVVANADGDTGPTIVRPIAIAPNWSIAPLVLEVAPRLSASAATWAGPVRLGAAGIGLVFAIVLAFGLYRNRDP
jgi:hypothetical protein